MHLGHPPPICRKTKCDHLLFKVKRNHRVLMEPKHKQPSGHGLKLLRPFGFFSSRSLSPLAMVLKLLALFPPFFFGFLLLILKPPPNAKR